MSSSWRHYHDIIIMVLSWRHHHDFIFMTSPSWFHHLDFTIMTSSSWRRHHDVVIITSSSWSQWAPIFVFPPGPKWALWVVHAGIFISNFLFFAGSMFARQFGCNMSRTTQWPSSAAPSMVAIMSWTSLDKLQPCQVVWCSGLCPWETLLFDQWPIAWGKECAGSD